MSARTLSILGVTGSIGQSTIRVIEEMRGADHQLAEDVDLLRRLLET